MNTIKNLLAVILLIGIPVFAGQLDGPHLTPESVTTARIKDEAITTLKMAPNSVTASKIDPGAVTTLKLHPEALDPAGDLLLQASGGDVGIGTVSPTAVLNVHGNVIISTGDLFLGGTGNKVLSIQTNAVVAVILDGGTGQPVSVTYKRDGLTQMSAGISGVTAFYHLRPFAAQPVRVGGVNSDFPTATLDVEGSFKVGLGAVKSTFTTTGNLLVPGKIGIGTDSPVQNLHVLQSAATTSKLGVGNGTSAGCLMLGSTLEDGTCGEVLWDGTNLTITSDADCVCDGS